jgi:hypothetical protein
MTGEMHRIDQDTGIDSNGDGWPLHLAIAKHTGGELRPFDVYQGPYIQTSAGKIWISYQPGEPCECCGKSGEPSAIVFNERTDRFVNFSENIERTLIAAVDLVMKGEGEPVDRG